MQWYQIPKVWFRKIFFRKFDTRIINKSNLILCFDSQYSAEYGLHIIFISNKHVTLYKLVHPDQLMSIPKHLITSICWNKAAFTAIKGDNGTTHLRETTLFAITMVQIKTKTKLSPWYYQSVRRTLTTLLNARYHLVFGAYHRSYAHVGEKWVVMKRVAQTRPLLCG